MHSLFRSPIESHAFFHQSAKMLTKQFSLPFLEAQQIVKPCPHCASIPTAFPHAVNPRGAETKELWQMDVTFVASLKPYSQVHLTIDTFSGFIWATAQRKKKLLNM